VRLILASLHYHLGVVTQSLEHLEKAANLDPLFPYYRLDLAEEIQRQSEPRINRNALAMLQQMTAEGPIFMEALELLDQIKSRHPGKQLLSAATENLRRNSKEVILSIGMELHCSMAASPLSRILSRMDICTMDSEVHQIYSRMRRFLNGNCSTEIYPELQATGEALGNLEDRTPTQFLGFLQNTFQSIKPLYVFIAALRYAEQKEIAKRLLHQVCVHGKMLLKSLQAGTLDGAEPLSLNNMTLFRRQRIISDLLYFMAQSHFHLALYARKEEKQASARKHFRECLKLLPNHREARAFLDKIYQAKSGNRPFNADAAL
jgi:tetratricopeptide (TPR) repeat protein